MARKATRIYVPLDVNFFDDDKVLDAGEAAGWLFLNMIAKAKVVDKDGQLTSEQIKRIGVTRWQSRLESLVAQGLVTPTLPGTYVISNWLKWNESRSDREERLRKDRERKGDK